MYTSEDFNNSIGYNFGTITIDREDYIDTDSFDGATRVYSAKSAKGGIAIGIYAESNTTLYNYGTITINGADEAYGIYAELTYT